MPDRRQTDGALYWRDLGHGCEIVVYGMTFGKARLCYSVDDMIVDGWCYADPAVALAAAVLWDGSGDPLDGWHRNPFTGRRRPNADPAQEHVAR